MTVTWPSRQTKETEPRRHSVTGVIGQVTPTGFTLEWLVADGWQNPHQVMQRAFVAWVDLWATMGRVQVAGWVVERGQPVDVSLVVSRWIADTAAGLGIVEAIRTPLTEGVGAR